MKTLVPAPPAALNYGMLIKAARLTNRSPYYLIEVQKEDGTWTTIVETKPVFLLQGCVLLKDEEEGSTYDVFEDPANQDGPVTTLEGVLHSLQAAAVQLRIQNLQKESQPIPGSGPLPVPSQEEAAAWLAEQMAA